MRKDVMASWEKRSSNEFPRFQDVWKSAEQRYQGSRKSYRRFSAAAAIVAAVIVGFSLQSPSGEPNGFVSAEDLLGSTSWTAPSDVLLPEYEFDIYQDLPTLIESTETAGGTLL